MHGAGEIKSNPLDTKKTSFASGDRRVQRERERAAAPAELPQQHEHEHEPDGQAGE